MRAISLRHWVTCKHTQQLYVRHGQFFSHCHLSAQSLEPIMQPHKSYPELVNFLLEKFSTGEALAEF